MPLIWFTENAALYKTGDGNNREGPDKNAQ